MAKKIEVWALKDKEEKEKKLFIEKLAIEISKKYKIEKKEALSLMKNKTLESLDNLKNQLEKWWDSNLNRLNKKELEGLFLTLKWAQEIIENYSKLEIKILKKDIEWSLNIDSIKNKLEDYLPPKLLEKAKNPQELHEHILWFALWTANTIVATIDALYQIWAWIIKAPYHLYLIVTWKWEIEWVEKI